MRVVFIACLGGAALVAIVALFRRRKTATGISLLVACVAGAAGVLYILHAHADLGSAVARANTLVASAGGPGKVCDEGNHIIRRFGAAKDRFFKLAELQDYPAIAAIAQHCVYREAHLLPGSPSMVSI